MKIEGNYGHKEILTTWGKVPVRDSLSKVIKSNFSIGLSYVTDSEEH